MATITSGHKLFYGEYSFAIAKGKREYASYDGASLPQIEINMKKGNAGSRLERIMMVSSILLGKNLGSNSFSVCRNLRKRRFYPVQNAQSSTEKHLKFLDSYLEKVHGDGDDNGDAKPASVEFFRRKMESIGKNDQQKADNSLRSLENYFRKIRSDLQASMNIKVNKDQEQAVDGMLKNNMKLKLEDLEDRQKSEEDVSDFYIVGILASINIAVFLFELATPVKNSNFELMSLPMVYGAKLNTSILMGEWWRLMTPMFLHSGFFHMSLGSWILLTLGLQVSQEYGSFTFLLIYLLGGISGNLISYLHTPEPTVGGTGPVFAIIGAWLIYQIQNKDFIPRSASDKMFRNAIIMTALTCALSNFGLIDDWAHLAAALTGVAYGFFTCPTIQVKDVSSGQKRVMLVKQYTDPCKSLAFFSVFLLLLSSLLLVVEPPVDLTG
ncbi:RHOMBOID-like protein 9, chloroplastic [Andrographis paniculata]|uniref:RHOMBOID-like protein 9, chloroplastic n=1 Tax=Andrographis paniculata TaxID=175694 RepID=UPI0021E85C8B|nr:RHOMBOID-like protein 9, chloroplastic [Andrographis paniculata]